jgi:protoporphyrin/coproporphyrin ferrochelatase
VTSRASGAQIAGAAGANVAPVGVLLMAYGTPETPDQVEPYFTHIRGGRTPSAESVARLRQRYELVGGRTPLLDITNELRDALERELNAAAIGPTYRVYVGMKHWHPFIGDVVPRIAADGVGELIAIALAPHYSRISIGGYRSALEQAVALLRQPLTVRFVESWHLHPPFIDFTADRVAAALADFPPSDNGKRDGDVVTVFSAHSLPARIREWGDPYETQLRESCEAVAERAGVRDWRFAWQSAGQTGEPWLGPDIVDYLDTLHGEGVRRVLSVPIGFVSDHLEIMYDIDYEARRKAESLGMTLRRTRMPNAEPGFVRVLASVVAAAPPVAAADTAHAAASSGH